MKKVITFLGSVSLLAGLSQISGAQYGATGALSLNSQGAGENGTAGIYYAGEMNMTFTPNTGPFSGTPSSFVAYCTVLDVEVAFGAPAWGATELLTSDFSPEPPNDSVNDNHNYDLLYGNHGSAANAIVGGEIAYVANTFSGSTINDTAAQIAIWDLEQGGNGTLTDGFFGTGGAAFGSGVEAGWQFGLDTATINALAMADAAAAYNGGSGHENSALDIWYKADTDVNGVPVSQDFVTPNSTPEPFTLAIGAMGIGLAIRRRIKR